MQYDQLIDTIADYVISPADFSSQAVAAATVCLQDALACAFLSQSNPDCTRLCAPWFENEHDDSGARVPGTNMLSDPMQAAFVFTAMIRWLDYNDTWLGKEWGHPSDNLGAILMAADYSRTPITMAIVIEAMIKAYEIQGQLALDNAFNAQGIDHVFLVKLASTAVVTWLWGGSHDAIRRALSQAICDGGTLRVYRHEPNCGPRKSWAAGDACARAVFLANLALRFDEPGYATPLTTPTWGLQDAAMQGTPVELTRPLSSFVIENVLFKVDVPAEFHGQTAIECARQLYPLVKDKWQSIKHVHIATHESALRIIVKEGDLENAAARDHCMQYMVAVMLLTGRLTSDQYADAYHQAHPEIDALRAKMNVTHESAFTQAYLDIDKRSIASKMAIEFDNGERSDWVSVHYPIGHPERRDEALPLLKAKFMQAAGTVLGEVKASQLQEVIHSPDRLMAMQASGFVQLCMSANDSGRES